MSCAAFALIIYFHLRKCLLIAPYSVIKRSIGGGITDFNDQWKVLIYDAECRDVISPLMNVASLRRKGVTLHLLVSSAR